ncbi:MAG: acylphosphatase [Bacteroidales bacterium]|nr:acylphosphatase [Bacteroidales bacterium]
MVRHLQMIITGKVENTGFRIYALRGANQFHLTGEVSQQPDKVIIEAEGEEEHLADFEQWCLEGPEGSEISALTKHEKELVGYEDFRIL